MNDERLLMLADHLDKREVTPEHGFNLSDWRCETACGTVCCAIGDACDIPEFQAQGLVATQHRYSARTLCPQFAGFFRGWGAVEEFFGLGAFQARYLFSGDDYPNRNDTPPSEVAARIRAFVKSGGEGVCLT
jgi:hypothetical protein